MRRSYEYIVLGCGGIGSGAAYWLARRAGADVLGLEQFKLGHHHGGAAARDSGRWFYRRRGVGQRYGCV